MYATIGDAIPDYYGNLVLVKGNKVLCKVTAFGSMDAQASFNFPEDFFEEQIAPKMTNKVPPLTTADGKVMPATKFCSFRYCQFTGQFLRHNLSEAEPVLEEWLADTRVVDKFYLSCGMVPDSFADVEGYRALLRRDDDNDKVEKSN